MIDCMRVSLALVLVGSLGMTACASVAGEPLASQVQSASMGTPFTLKPGETARVTSEQAQVRFDRVTADSRCPRNVQCVMAGEATVRVSVTLRGQAERTLELRTTPQDEQTTAGDYLLKLADLVPLPDAGRPVKPADYRATFILTPAPK